ncbi:hypothetical protein QBC37DRAFT_34833 [Rhypophila decipiens]|uniref:Uncharacterized protein n=1 Tax=Rhypophila decipiens TaxID=261697 RepID=A0AAN7B4X1_9PEZI|nr:hypothetical protein QBC37DRAFT_34833 [Rhypophila decipiens]
MASAVFDRETPPPPLDQFPPMPCLLEPAPFEGVLKLFNKLKKIWEKEENDYVSFKGITLEDFKAIDKSRDRRRLIYRFDYDEETELLVVKIPNNLHTRIRLRLYELYIRQTDPEAWESTGSTQFHAVIRGKTVRKEPDSSGMPFKRDEIYRWPTPVVQTGYSESIGSLRRDMRRWFEASKHDVKIVLLIQWDRRRQRIVVERWEEEEELGQAKRPVCRHVVTITREEETGGEGPVNYVVTGGCAILLPFELLFLRQPQGAEADIVITTDDLKEWAGYCWYVARG